MSRSTTNRNNRVKPVGLALLVFVCLHASPAAADIVAESGDAFIAHDVAAGAWSVSAGGATLQLRINASSDFAILALSSPSGQSWLAKLSTDTTLTVNDEPLPFGRASAGFAFRNADVAVD